MPRIGKFIGTEIRFVVARACGRRGADWDGLLIGLFGCDGNVVELDSGDSCTAL